MNSVKSFILILFSGTILLLFGSCDKAFKADNYTAYFGGEVTNPINRYILFFSGETLIDSIPLDKDNRFFIKFDSLAPGLYTFRHEPEYQYVYFDKNDSLLVSINSRDFDESIVFTGRGDQKNNFLMELYLQNEKDRDKMFKIFDYDIKRFIATVEASYKKSLELYHEKREEIKWSDDFDIYARAAVDFPYYSKKELYPLVHKIRTGEKIIDKLPKDYYAFRKKVNYNNEKLNNFSPFVKYVSHMLNNVAATKHRNDNADEAILSLNTNTSKMVIADTLIKNEHIKNTILNNIAFTYLMEDQNMSNNQQFLTAYHKYSTDRSQKNEITKIGNAIKLLSAGNSLPDVTLVDKDGNKITFGNYNKAAVIFFWTDKASVHMAEAHKKVLEFQQRYPNYEYIAVNLDESQEKWLQILANYEFGNITQFRVDNFEDLRMKWAITKIHRTIVLNPDGTIKNAFTNLFDSDFENCLKK